MPRSRLATWLKPRVNHRIKAIPKKTMMDNSVSRVKAGSTNNIQSLAMSNLAECTNHRILSMMTTRTQAVSSQVKIKSTTTATGGTSRSMACTLSCTRITSTQGPERNLTCMNSSTECRVITDQNTTTETWEVTSKQLTTAAASSEAQTPATSIARWAHSCLQSTITATTSMQTWSTTQMTSTQ